MPEITCFSDGRIGIDDRLPSKNTGVVRQVECHSDHFHLNFDKESAELEPNLDLYNKLYFMVRTEQFGVIKFAGSYNFDTNWRLDSSLEGRKCR